MFRQIIRVSGSMNALRVRSNASRLLLKNNLATASRGAGGNTAVPAPAAGIGRDSGRTAMGTGMSGIGTSETSAPMSGGSTNMPSSGTTRSGTPPAVSWPSDSEANVHADRGAPSVEQLVSQAKSKSDVRDWAASGSPKGGSNSVVSGGPASEDRDRFSSFDSKSTSGSGFSSGSDFTASGERMDQSDRATRGREKSMEQDAKDSIAGAAKKAKDVLKHKAKKAAHAIGITSDKPKLAGSQKLSSEPTMAVRSGDADSDFGKSSSVKPRSSPSSSSSSSSSSESSQSQSQSQPLSSKSDSERKGRERELRDRQSDNVPPMTIGTGGPVSMQKHYYEDEGEGAQVRQMRAAARPTTDVPLSKDDWQEINSVSDKTKKLRDDYIHNHSSLSGSANIGGGLAAKTPKL